MKKTYIILISILLLNLSIKNLAAQNVGIGTITPQAKLEVKDTIKASIKIRSKNFQDTTQLIFSNRNSSEAGTDFTISSNRERGLKVSSASDLIANNHDSIMMLTPNGRVGINETTPSERLDVNGNINVTGTIKANGTSGQPNQVLITNSGGNLAWGNINDYKNFETFTTTGTTNWIVPASVTKLLVELWGGGGGGSQYCGGGGGGYSLALFTVVPLSSVTISLGAGGAGNINSGNFGISTSVTAGGVVVSGLAGSGPTYDAANHVVAGGIGGGGSSSAGFKNFMTIAGKNGEMIERINSGAGFEMIKGAKGGDSGNTNGTGGSPGILIQNISTSSIDLKRNPSPGKQPGGGGGGSAIIGTVGEQGGNGMVIIHY